MELSERVKELEAENKRLREALKGVVGEAWSTASAPPAPRQYQEGYEDGKRTTCQTLAYYIGRVLGEEPVLTRPRRRVE